MQHSSTRVRCRLTHQKNTTRALAPNRDIEHAVSGANQVHDALCARSAQRIGVFDFASTVVPARYVPGDFVLSFEERGATFLVLGDLMGKGLSAAMWLTHVVDLTRRACEQEEALPAIMNRLNHEMHCSRVGVPLTSLFIVRIEIPERKITYSCGGCPAGFLLGADQSVRMLNHGGPVLGALKTASYEAEAIEIEPGQVLLAVSDGIIEVHHGNDFELRPDRVASHLQFTAGDSAESIVHSLAARVRNSTPSLVDDLSIMAIRHAR